MRSQNFRAFKPQPIPLGTEQMFVITIRKDRSRRWEREEMFLRDREQAVGAAIHLQKKFPDAQINLNGGAFVVVEGRIFQIRQEPLNGKFVQFSNNGLIPE